MSYDIDAIHGEMLSLLPDGYQKTIGFPAYDLTRAFALAAVSLSGDVEIAKAATDADNLTGDGLTRWCSQRKGIARRPAAYATGSVTVSGSGTVTAGDLFESGGGVQFAADETKAVAGGGTVAVTAVLPGAAGNVAANTVTRMPVTLQGISAVTNPGAMTGGYDAESDAALRARYYDAVNHPVTGANKNAYRAWALEVTGVGRVKVFPLANGDNTVEVCIIDSNMQPATGSLLAAVQSYIDPGCAGTGEGVAPMGAYCTVTTPGELTVHAACTVTLAAGYEAAEVLAGIQSAITAYLAEVAFVGTYVSYAKIANCVNDAAGVLDYTGLTVNGGVVNIPVGDREVAVLGEVAIS